MKLGTTVAGVLLAVAGAASSWPVLAQENVRVITKTLTSSSAHKECFPLNDKQMIRYWYRADALIDFNIQYVEANKTVFEFRRDRQALGSGAFVPKATRDYCLVWTNPFSKPVLFRVELARLAR